MDDGFSGADTESEVITLAQNMPVNFETTSMPLDKWKSNSRELMAQLKGERTPIFFDEKQTTLGIKWDL